MGNQEQPKQQFTLEKLAEKYKKIQELEAESEKELKPVFETIKQFFKGKKVDKNVVDPELMAANRLAQLTLEVDEIDPYHVGYKGEEMAVWYIRRTDVDKQGKPTSNKGGAVFLIIHPNGKLTVQGVGERPEHAQKRDWNIRFDYVFGETQEEGRKLELDMNEAGWQDKAAEAYFDILQSGQEEQWYLSLSGGTRRLSVSIQDKPQKGQGQVAAIS